MDHRFASGRFTLAAHLARPPKRSSSGPRLPAVVICHGFPAGGQGAEASAGTLPELADRIANELGFLAMTFTFRGAGKSEGDFSLHGWLDDITAAVDHVNTSESVSGLWLAGFGTGGALCVCAAARDDRIVGVAALGAPADFDDWAGQPRRLLQHARDIGLISDPSFPQFFERWARALREIRAVQCVARLPPRPLLVVHGTEDDAVPDFDARVVADAHGSAELRLLSGAGHRLRHDPRAVAVLLGWLDRQRHRRLVP
ncbi:MAG: alpha/beta hydrolase [Acidimicrobiales bacterium]